MPPENIKNRRQHLRTVLQALFVSFLWSTSWVLIKIGVADIPPLTFAGLRYMLGFLCLALILMRKGRWKGVRELALRDWLRLAALGLVWYTFTQGSVFVALSYMPAVTANLLLSFSPLLVAGLGMIFLSERLVFQQWLGVGLSLVGILFYFSPETGLQGEPIGLTAVFVALLANAGAVILGRDVNRRGNLPPLVVTIVSMGVGGLVLLVSGLAVQGLPVLSPLNWLIVGWLAVVNTAFAFTLWNLTQRTLSAVESSTISGSMGIQIPILAVLFLGERLNLREILGLVLAGIGILMVQLVKKEQQTALHVPAAMPDEEDEPVLELGLDLDKTGK
jgi:drug/metabolite transporter (DMT)-like permease